MFMSMALKLQTTRLEGKQKEAGQSKKMRHPFEQLHKELKINEAYFEFFIYISPFDSNLVNIG